MKSAALDFWCPACDAVPGNLLCSQDKFMHDIHVAVARNYVENLKEAVKKGMRKRAEQGVYPGRAGTVRVSQQQRDAPPGSEPRWLPADSLQDNSNSLQRNSIITATEFEQLQRSCARGRGFSV